jgi:Alw26I/Eco31I/Esp3I family type II restriction m6 adenine DNA methyltransferase
MQEEYNMNNTTAVVAPIASPKRVSVDKEMDVLLRKQTGSYYTADSLSITMAEELVDSLPVKKRRRLFDLRFLEPCVGNGSFVFAYLTAASKLGFTKEQYTTLLNNIYVCDTNENALTVYKQALIGFAKEHFDIVLKKDYFDKHIGGGLLFDLDNDRGEYIPISTVFGKDSENSFDIVITNPPYKNLKAEHTHYPDDTACKRDKDMYAHIGILATKTLKYSVAGVMNIYKLFIEEIIERYAKTDGVVSLLIPSSILTNKTCSKLRARIFETSGIKSIKVIGETSSVVDTRQSLCALLIHKGKSFKSISVCSDYCSPESPIVNVDTSRAVDVDSGHAILVLNHSDYNTLRQLKSFSRIKDLDFIVNLRGELDLTVNKNAITAKQGQYPLIRGRNISFYSLIDFPSSDYVEDQFVENSSKAKYIHSERIICQQIANIAKDRRLTYAVVPKDVVLGNSCNFISVSENEYGIDLYFMIGLLNSSIMNWFFKIQSNNNHINNYEIDTFPVPVGCSTIREISELAKQCTLTDDKTVLFDKIDMLVNEAFGLVGKKDFTERKSKDAILGMLSTDLSYIIPGLSNATASDIIQTGTISDAVFFEHHPTATTFDKKAARGIAEKYSKIMHGEILNHTTFKLSDLDLEMARAVPQGGSWKDIPPETVAKSKRLVRITETGGRTTLYGRIDYEKPSYTITTYFNRPGNGTYIHPIYDRVISVREAARFQSFPDSYYFLGNKAQLLNQVGNAIPSFFAFQIAKSIVAKVGCTRSIDLFCGAGGLTVGFKQAGVKSVLSADIELSACLTLKTNNPEINVLCGDITKKEIKDAIIRTAVENQADMICGGPPCQGFSMAGFRLTDDPRNQLFKDFIDIVAAVEPKVVVFENVEGLMSFQGGGTYRLIHEMFGEIGYETEGRILQTQLYGVPQKRKRVILVCTKKDTSILPCDLYPAQVTEVESEQITARMAIYDLEKVECGDTARYDDTDCSDYVRMLKSEILPDEFLSRLQR